MRQTEKEHVTLMLKRFSSDSDLEKKKNNSFAALANILIIVLNPNYGDKPTLRVLYHINKTRILLQNVFSFSF